LLATGGRAIINLDFTILPVPTNPFGIAFTKLVFTPRVIGSAYWDICPAACRLRPRDQRIGLVRRTTPQPTPTL
jgi:hypothetical protein